MATRKKSLVGGGISRGCFESRIPGFGPVIRSAGDIRDLPAAINTISLSNVWNLLYLHTPTRVRIGSTRMPWLNAEGGTAVLVAPFETFWTDTRRSRGQGHHGWLRIEGLDASPIRTFSRQRWGTPYIRDPEGVLGDMMTGLVDLVTELQDRSFWAMQLVGNRILDLVAHAATAEDGSMVIQPLAAAIDPMVARILAYLSSHLHGKLTVDTIARALHASASTVSHRFRAATGETVLTAHRRMRLMEVKRLLATGQSQEAIATTVGYCDVHHLSREFKRQEGITPGTFVEQYLPDIASKVCQERRS